MTQLITLLLIAVMLLIYLMSCTISNKPTKAVALLFQHIVNNKIHNTIHLNSTIQQSPGRVNRVVFFTCHDYVVLPEYAKKSRAINAEFCERHGYDFLEFVYPKNTMSPYWTRVDRFITLCDQYKDDTIFVYVDLDAVVNPQMHRYRLEDILRSLSIKKDYDVYIGKDADIRKYVNSGVIILRNTQWSRSLLEEWWRHYDPTKWLYNGTKWVCVLDKRRFCKWAEDYYEQGELEKLYYNDWNNSRDHIAILDVNVMSNAALVNRNTFIYHLMGISDSDRLAFLTKIGN